MLWEMTWEYHNDDLNSHKFYRLTIEEEPDSIFPYVVTRHWGRCGSRGDYMKERFLSYTMAVVHVTKRARIKENKGYVVTTASDAAILDEEPAIAPLQDAL